MKHGKSHFSQVFLAYPTLRRMVDLRRRRWTKKGIEDGGASECSTVAVGIGYNYLIRKNTDFRLVQMIMNVRLTDEMKRDGNNMPKKCILPKTEI